MYHGQHINSSDLVSYGQTWTAQFSQIPLRLSIRFTHQTKLFHMSSDVALAASLEPLVLYVQNTPGGIELGTPIA